MLSALRQLQSLIDELVPDLDLEASELEACSNSASLDVVQFAIIKQVSEHFDPETFLSDVADLIDATVREGEESEVAQ